MPMATQEGTKWRYAVVLLYTASHLLMKIDSHHLRHSHMLHLHTFLLMMTGMRKTSDDPYRHDDETRLILRPAGESSAVASPRLGSANGRHHPTTIV